MKYSFFTIALIACFSIIFASCTNDSNDDNTITDQTTIIRSIQDGDWKITSFIDSEKDETMHYSGYIFRFQEDNSIVASNGTNDYIGTWSITKSSSSEDSKSNHLYFNISFDAPKDFEDLTEDWEIISRNESKIDLIHVSGGNGGTDLLTFEQI